MNIRSKLLISAALSLVFSAVIVVSVFLIIRNINHESAQFRAYNEIVIRTQSLNVLVSRFPIQVDRSHMTQIRKKPMGYRHCCCGR
jgi:NAD kinase